MEAINLERNIPAVLPTGDIVFPPPVAAPPAEDELDEAAIATMFAATKKKKKKDKSKRNELDQPSGDGEPSNFRDPAGDDQEEITYDEMLTRIYQLMGATYTASEMTLKRLQRPRMAAIGSKRVGWINFGKTAETLNRSLEHLSSFIEAEFGTTVSIDAKDCLVIKGRFSSEHIETVLKKYVEQYIKCRTCKGMETTLQRDPETRLSFLKCLTCQSQWTVSNIQKGFHATMKGERKAARAAE